MLQLLRMWLKSSVSFALQTENARCVIDSIASVYSVQLPWAYCKVLSFLTLSTMIGPKIVFFRSNLLVFMLTLTC